MITKLVVETEDGEMIATATAHSFDQAHVELEKMEVYIEKLNKPTINE